MTRKALGSTPEGNVCVETEKDKTGNGAIR
jgi:hypothetical protein